MRPIKKDIMHPMMQRQRQPRFLGSSHSRLFSSLTIIIVIVVSSAVTFIVSLKLMMLTLSESQYPLQSILPQTTNTNTNNQSQSKAKGKGPLPLRVIALCACRCISNDIEKKVKCNSFYNHLDTALQRMSQLLPEVEYVGMHQVAIKEENENNEDSLLSTN